VFCSRVLSALHQLVDPPHRHRVRDVEVEQQAGRPVEEEPVHAD